MRHRPTRKLSGRASGSNICNKKYNLSFFRGLLYYAFAASLAFAFTNIFKTYISEPRPSAVWQCNPNNFREHYTMGTLNTWSREVGCTNVRIVMPLSDCPDQHNAGDIATSCPSGHSSSSAAIAITLALHLRRHMGPCRLNSFLAPFRAALAAFLWMAPLVVGLTRVYDNKHSSADVALGLLIGSFCGVIADELWAESDSLAEGSASKVDEKLDEL